MFYFLKFFFFFLYIYIHIYIHTLLVLLYFLLLNLSPYSLLFFFFSFANRIHIYYYYGSRYNTIAKKLCMYHFTSTFIRHTRLTNLFFFCFKKDSLWTIASAGLGGLLGSMYLDSRLLLNRDFHQIRAGAASQL